MHNRLKDLKDSLEKTTFKDFSFNKDLRNNVHTRYSYRKNTKRSADSSIIKYSLSIAACVLLALGTVYFFVISDGMNSFNHYVTGENKVFTLSENSPELTNEKLIQYRKAIKKDVINTADVDFTGYSYATVEYVYEKLPKLAHKTYSLGGSRIFPYLNQEQTKAIVIMKDGDGTNRIYYYKYNSSEWVQTDFKRIKGTKIEMDNNSKQMIVQGAEGKPKIIEAKFDPSLIEFYTGKPMKFESYTLDDVKPGVYVTGVKTHSGKQAITVYSKIEENTTQKVRLLIDGGTLKIMVDEEKNDSASSSDQNKVLQTLITEEPTHFEVYRNRFLVKKGEIIYGIE